ncbi:MAG: MBL fold metallo-hydrolase, partial [Bacteroidota bacterium]
GDSGYDTHFKTIGEKFGPFDLAILECGQYNLLWPLIHMMPEETVQASIDLKAKWLLPVHWGKFTLANHPWDDPAIRSVKRAAEKGVNITTPMIGEPVVLGRTYPNQPWWKE